MAHEINITRDFGHPWTMEKGWDLMEVQTDTESEMDFVIASAESKFWNVWIRDNVGNMSAVLFKPAGIKQKWHCRAKDPSMRTVEIILE